MLGGGSLGTTPTVFGEVVGKGKRKEGKTERKQTTLFTVIGRLCVYQVLVKGRV